MEFFYVVQKRTGKYFGLDVNGDICLVDSRKKAEEFVNIRAAVDACYACRNYYKDCTFVVIDEYGFII